MVSSVNYVDLVQPLTTSLTHLIIWGHIVIVVPANLNIGGTRPLRPIGIDAPGHGVAPLKPDFAYRRPSALHRPI
jgi:hypothetical protein